MIDWSVNLGHILVLGGFVVSGIGFVWAVRSDVKILATRLDPLEKAVLKLTDVLVRLGGHEERINAVERDLERSYSRSQRRKSGPG